MCAFQCTTCRKEFQKKSTLDCHRQKEHQMRVTVKFSDGSIKRIERDIPTKKFICPVCNESLTLPKSMQRHALQDCRLKQKHRAKRQAVVMSDDDQVSTVVLQKFGIFVNQQIGFLLCTTCHYGVGPNPSQVRAHLARIHSVIHANLPTNDEIQRCLQRVTLTTEEKLLEYGSGKVTVPIKGLPIYEGSMCSTCNYMCCCKRTMERHTSSHDAGASAPVIYPVSVQTIFNGTRKRFFRVSPSVSMSPVPQSFRRELQKFHKLQNDIGSNDVDDGIICPLLRQLHWHIKLPMYTEYSSYELMEMTKLSQNSTVDQNLYAAVSLYFERGIKQIDSTSYLTRRYVIAGSTNVSNAHKGFGYVKDASGTYRRHMTKLIRMAALCFQKCENQNPVWRFSSQSQVGECAERLQTLCDIDDFEPDCDEVQTQVRKILNELYMAESDTTVSNSTDDFKRYSVYRYVVCSSITGGELHRIKIKQANSITSICAALVYWARLFVLVSIVSMDVDTRNKTLYYIQDGVPTSFNAFLEIMKLGKCLSGPGEGQNPIVHWIDDKMTSLVCRTATVTKRLLQDMASSLSVGIKHTLQQILLQGFNIERLRAQIESTKFIDDINAKADGSWFMTRKDNHLSVEPHHLLSFFGSKYIRDSLWCDENGGSWNIPRVKRWLLACDDFMDDMIILIHFTFGQPARASELPSFRIRDSHLEYRSVYAIRNRFSLIQVYHKSINVTGKFKPIVRFAPMSLNTDIILYFYLVRPTQAFLFDVAFPDEVGSGQCYLDYVFVKVGKVMNAEQIRRSIAKGFSKFSEMKLDVSTYRHVATSMIDPHFRDMRLSDDLFDEQAGHSHETASTVYARASNDPSSLSRDQLHKFWIGSSSWHQFLGLDLHSPSVPMRIGTPTPVNNFVYSDNTSLSKQIGQITSVLSKVETQVNAMRVESVTYTPIQKTIPPVSPAEFASAKRVVERFAGTQKATFLSVEQGIALSLLIAKPQKHRIIILPTGGGKSILYMAHYIANPKSPMTTIIIVPTVALLNESVVKTKLRDFSSCKYATDLRFSGRQFNLVFAAVEHVGQEDFHEYLTLLKARKHLHAIFIDEAHLIITGNSYRPQMALIPTLTTIGVPLVLLSGTVPITMEKNLSLLFRVQFETIRSQTSRKNISYNVEHVSDIKAESITVMKNRQLMFWGSRSRCIAYCVTRSEVDDLCGKFYSKTGLSISKFHAGMDQQEQAKAVARWKSGICIWMIATNAFGVGIDYPEVRVVLHLGGAWSLLDYAQVTGRAGRDGDKPSLPKSCF